MNKRNRLFVFLGMMLIITRVCASEPVETSQFMYEIEFQVFCVDPKIEQERPHRGPIVASRISIDGRALRFITPCDGCMLRVVNKDGETEYITVVPDNTTSLELPSDLEGCYELQIVRGNFCFYGFIEL